MPTTDTLVCDSARLATWQVNPDYNYNRELVTPEVDLIGQFLQWVNQLLAHLFNNQFAAQYSEVVLIGITLLLLLALLWFLYRQRLELFQRTRHNPLSYQVYEETIYGIDFAQEMTVALHRADYREAIRLLYLQTLRQLADSGQIDWQPQKTPTEYLYELRIEILRAPFRELTNHFLRVRYGNFDATQEIYEYMKQTQQKMKGGDR